MMSLVHLNEAREEGRTYLSQVVAHLMSLLMYQFAVTDKQLKCKNIANTAVNTSRLQTNTLLAILLV